MPKVILSKIAPTSSIPFQTDDGRGFIENKYFKLKKICLAFIEYMSILCTQCVPIMFDFFISLYFFYCNCKCNLFTHVTPKSLELVETCTCIEDRNGIWSVGFCGGRKTGEPEEKPSEQGREPTTNQPTNSFSIKHPR